MNSENNVISNAADALDAFAKGPATDAANELADVFEIAGDRIANSLERAAQTGALSFNDLAESILNDFARLAVSELITAPLEGLVSGLTQSIGQAAGASKTAPVMVNLNLGNGASKPTGPQPSTTQIASQVTRALQRAQSRN
jgi:lambda family phage tail tape measure protein